MLKSRAFAYVYQTFQFEFESRNVIGYGEPIRVAGTYFRHVIRLLLSDETRRELPQHVVVKIEDHDLQHPVDDAGDNFFDTEAKIYRHLQRLQGEHIPKLYGIAIMGGSRAMVLSDVGEITMVDENMPLLEESVVRQKLRKPLEAVRLAGVYHENAGPKNIVYCDGKFIVLDFELAKVCLSSVQEMTEEVDMQIDDLVRYYKERQRAIRKDAFPPEVYNHYGFAGRDYYL
ncbi:hypothetical protein CEP53_014336 [Fusarium sp. AF-6]|nr:hypothetical protein CEP53_014336 [Fusarium sp. AF-6]